MIIGCPKEIKTQEHRVGITPSGVYEAIHHGHEIIVQTMAGFGAGFRDDDYVKAGARIVDTAEEIFASADMIVKVKEPQPNECAMLREGQILFTYLHLAADKEQTLALMESGCIAIAYETITDKNGGLPLLAPMSEVAGRLAPQVGSWAMQKVNGGSGKLLGGIPGVEPAKVLVIGGGMVGTNAARVAAGMGADVTVLDRNIERMRYLDDTYRGVFKTSFADAATTERMSMQSDLIIGAVLVPGAAAPKLLTDRQVGHLKSGTVLVDVAIDQGGCFETSHATTHDDPIYMKHGVVHYCVANMPGAVATTSTMGLTNATMPYMISIANQGAETAMRANPHLMNGLNVYKGKLVYTAVGEALGISTKVWNE